MAAQVLDYESRHLAVHSGTGNRDRSEWWHYRSESSPRCFIPIRKIRLPISSRPTSKPTPPWAPAELSVFSPIHLKTPTGTLTAGGQERIRAEWMSTIRPDARASNGGRSRRASIGRRIRPKGFIGVGNDTRLGNETNYTTNQIYGLGVFGLNFTEDLQLALSVRPRRVRIDKGGFDDLPSIFQIFPHQKGINGGSEVLGQAVLAYDTRDSLQVPRKGGLAEASISGSRIGPFGSSISYTRFGGELRRYYAINDKVTLAGHAFVEYNPSGNETPFWSMGRLGGQESLLTDQETLRGYGAGRFVDNNLAVANVEVGPGFGITTSSGPTAFWSWRRFSISAASRITMGFNPLSQSHSGGRDRISRDRGAVRGRLRRCRLRRRRRRGILGHQLPF